MAIRFTDATPALKLTPLPADGQAPHLNSGEVDVWITAEVDRDVKAHLRTRDVEQGGLLVGRAFCDPQTGTLAHVRITACASADDSQGTAFSLRMGARVWQAAQALMRPDELIVGWYHSHPGLSAFFSDTDRQTQRAFFNNPYSVGWVVDPTDGDEALFLGGDRPAEEIVASIDKGLYATNFGGGQVDITSGKFVFSASEAYWVEDGKILYPVKGATIVGNGPDALTRVSMIGNDMRLDTGVGVCGKEGQSVPVGVGQPTLRIDGLTVGGTA